MIFDEAPQGTRGKLQTTNFLEDSMNWISYQLLALVFDSINSILDKRFTQNAHTHPSLYVLSFGLVAMGGLLWLPTPPTLSIEALFIMGLGIFFVGIVWFYYHTLPNINISRLVPLMRLSGVARILILHVLGDRLSLLGWGALGLVMVGTAVFTHRPNITTQTQGSTKQALLIASLLAGYGVAWGHLSLQWSPLELLWWEQAGILLGTLICLLIPSQRKALKQSWQGCSRVFRSILLLEQIGRLGRSYLSLLVIQMVRSVTITAVLHGLKPLVVLLLASLFLGEKIAPNERWYKACGAIGMMSGALCMVWV